MGPQARDLLQSLSEADFSDAAFPWLSGQLIRVAGIETIALRLSYAGELGWELHVPLGEIGRLYDAIIEAGRSLRFTSVRRVRAQFHAPGEGLSRVGRSTSRPSARRSKPGLTPSSRRMGGALSGGTPCWSGRARAPGAWRCSRSSPIRIGFRSTITR